MCIAIVAEYGGSRASARVATAHGPRASASETGASPPGRPARRPRLEHSAVIGSTAWTGERRRETKTMAGMARMAGWWCGQWDVGTAAAYARAARSNALLRLANQSASCGDRSSAWSAAAALSQLPSCVFASFARWHRRRAVRCEHCRDRAASWSCSWPMARGGERGRRHRSRCFVHGLDPFQ